MQNKLDIIRSYFPDTVTEIQFVQVDLDITGLGIADILRNINKTFPKNSAERNKVANGYKVIAILCKSELLEPLNGIILMIHGNTVEINLQSRAYALLAIPEKKLYNDHDINDVNSWITKNMISMIRNETKKFDEFFMKYLYDDYEELKDDDE